MSGADILLRRRRAPTVISAGEDGGGSARITRLEFDLRRSGARVSVPSVTLDTIDAMPADNTVTEILRTAHESVTAAGVPDDLRAMAFEKALELLGVQGALSSAAPPTPPPTGTVSGSGASGGAAAADKTFDKIAEKLKVTKTAVEKVFHIEGESLELSIGTSKLPKPKVPGTKMIALLLAAGRQAGGWDAEWTAVSDIRAVCEAFGRLDGSNFAGTIREMDNVFNFSGARRSRKVKVKVNREGFEDAGALVRELGGETSAASK